MRYGKERGIKIELSAFALLEHVFGAMGRAG
jgi:hypothetical protein